MPNGYPDGVPDPTWTAEQMLLWVSDKLIRLDSGLKNHLASHDRWFKVFLAAFAGFIAITGAVMVSMVP